MRFVLFVFVCFFCLGYVSMSNTDSSFSTKLTLVDSINRPAYVNEYMGKWIDCNKDRLSLCGVIMGNFYVSVNDLKTKAANGFTSQVPNEEYIGTAFEYKDKIYVQSVILQSASKITCLIRTFNRNTVELLSSEICLTSAPKDDFDIKEMYKDEKLKVAVPENSVFYSDPKGIDKISYIVSEASDDKSKLLCGFIARNEDDNHCFFAKVLDLHSGIIKEIKLQLGTSRDNPKYLESFSADVLNNGQVLFFLRDYADGEFSGFTMYKLENNETKKVSVKISDFIKSEEDFKFVKKVQRVYDLEPNNVILYLYLEEDERKIAVKVKMDMEKETVLFSQTIRLNPDIEGVGFDVYTEDGRDELLLLQNIEGSKREMNTLKIGGIGFGNSMNVVFYKNKDYYVVNVGKDFKKKWEVKGTYEEIDTKDYLPLEVESAGKNMAVRIYKKTGIDREIWDMETGKTLNVEPIHRCPDENYCMTYAELITTISFS